jgi:hypothetical protein
MLAAAALRWVFELWQKGERDKVAKVCLALVMLMLATRPYERAMRLWDRSELFRLALEERDYDETRYQLEKWRTDFSEYSRTLNSLYEVERVELMLAILEAHQGKKDAARTRFEALRAKVGDHPSILRNGVQIMAMIEDKQASLALLAEYERLYPNGGGANLVDEHFGSLAGTDGS